MLTVLVFLLVSQGRACLWCLCRAVTRRRSVLHKCSSFKKTFHFQPSFNLWHKALPNLIEFSAIGFGNKTCRCLGDKEMMLVASNYFKITGKCILKNRKERKKEILPSLVEASTNIQASIFISADSMDVAGRVII